MASKSAPEGSLSTAKATTKRPTKRAPSVTEERAANDYKSTKVPRGQRKPIPAPKRSKREAEAEAIEQLAPTLAKHKRDPILISPLKVKDERPEVRDVTLGQPSQIAINFGHDDVEYRREYCEALVRYFAREPTHPVVTQRKVGNKIIETTKYEVTELPTLAGFAVSIGTYKEMLQAWAGRYKEFARAMDIAKSWQERILVANGMMGRYNTSFAIMAAKNLIGWREKFEVELSGDVNVFIRKFTKDDDGNVIDANEDDVKVVDVTPRQVNED